MRRVPVFSVGFASVRLLASVATFTVVGSASDAGYAALNGVLVDHRWLAAAG